MSSAAKGAQRVGSVLTQLAHRGYRCARIASSGQRKGARRDEQGIAADVIAFAPEDTSLPHLVVEVGGAGKRVGVAFVEMHEHPLPGGFVALVARCVARRWRWYISDVVDAYCELDDALDALREA